MANNTRKVGLKIEVDGEKEYKQAIRELNRDNAVLASELKKVQEQYKGNEDSMEALRAKSEIFQNQLATQSRKVEETRERLDAWRAKLDEVREKFGATSEQYLTAQKNVQEYEIKLNNAQTQEIRLERALEETNKALEEQGDAMEEAGEKTVGLGDGLDSITGKLGIQIPDAAKEALNGMGDFSAGTVAEMTSAAAAIAAVYKVGKELYDLTIEAAAKSDALLTRSAQTGLDTSTLQGLDYASRFLDFEGLDKTLGHFTQTMAAANEGAKAQTEAFAQLGISVTDVDGNLLNSYDTFLAAIDALGKIENATERDALANDLFGKSYADMKPLIDAGTESLQAYIDEATRLGYVVDEQVVQKLGNLADALEKNEASADALKTKLAGELAPTFTLLTDASTGVQDAIGRILDDETSKRWAEFGIAMTGPLGDGVIRLKALAEWIQRLREEEDETAATTEDSSGKMAEAIAKATESATENIQALRDAYDESYEAARKSIDGQFGLWEKFSGLPELTLEDMVAAMEQQAAYFEIYNDKFNELLNRNVEGVDKLAERFNDGSLESAAALQALSQASDEEISALIQKMNETEGAKNDLATTFANLKTDVSGSLETIESDYAATVEAINGKTGEIDFAPFDAAVEAAFGGMEARAATAAETAVATVQAAINTINSMEINPIVEQSTQWHDVGQNASGTDNWRGGLTWVGEAGPELVSLPRGTQIYSNQESRQMAAAATDTRALETMLGRVLTALEQIRAENQAQNMRRRMA